MILGIVLTAKSFAGGVFTYASFILEAISKTCKKTSMVKAYYVDAIWAEYLQRYSNIYGEQLWGDYFSCIETLNNSACDVLLMTDQLDWCRDISIPTITPIHDLMHIYEHGSGFPEIEDYECYGLIQQHCMDIYLYSAGILTDSELGKKHVLDQYGRTKADRVYVLPFSVPFYLNKQYGNAKSPVTGKYMFYPAQFWKHKNHEVLVRAISHLKKKGLDVKFVFVGSDKGNLEIINNLILTEGVKDNIEILGFVPDSDMYMLYKNARALVMPSFFGPTNIPPLEAMYMGCPVAVSNRYAMPEQVGDAGLTFDPYNVEEVAQIIEQLWSDDELCAKLSQAGLKQTENFSIEKFSVKLWDGINDVYRKEKSYQTKLDELLVRLSNGKKIYIYGAGEYAKYIYALLNYYGVNIDGFIVTKYYGIKNFLGKKIYEVSKIKGDNNITIVLGLHPRNVTDVMAQVKNNNIPDYCIVDFPHEYLHLLWSFLATIRGKLSLELMKKV